MDPKLIEYYRIELQHIRDAAAEFAQAYPKIAGRLNLSAAAQQVECADPYVERLLEGAAFLAARVQLKMDAEYAVFTQHLIDMIHPGYAAPTPSMVVARVEPDLGSATLVKGVMLPRGTTLTTRIPSGSKTSCRFQTAHDIKLWPLKIDNARYQGGQIGLGGSSGFGKRIQSSLQISFSLTAGSMVELAALEELDIFLPGSDVAGDLYELLLAHCVSVSALFPDGKDEVVDLKSAGVSDLGFDDEQSLLPEPGRGLSAYRLFKEYAAFPDRFRFFRITGLRDLMLKGGARRSFALIFHFSREVKRIERSVDASNFLLYCTPAVNLFRKTIERTYLNQAQHEFHLVTDRVRPLDFEIHSVRKVDGYPTDGVGEPFQFNDLYSEFDAASSSAYFSIRREPRLNSSVKMSSRMSRHENDYLASEMYISLADPNHPPYPSGIGQLAIDVLCSNRERPMAAISGSEQDFSLEVSAPVLGIRCVSGPTRPVPAISSGLLPWRLISLLGVNHLSLLDGAGGDGASALREMLFLFASDTSSIFRKQIEGLKSINAARVTLRLPINGPICFGNGVGVVLEVDERHFDGTGVLILGALMDRFFARYASLNSFTQLTLNEVQRGEIKKWKPRAGRRMIF